MQRDPVQTSRARRIRRDLSPVERQLWQALRGHRLQGWKFFRQHPVGSYVLDFAARRELLAIEVDGETHGGREEYDSARTQWLERQGWRVLRFTNAEVMANIEGVAMTILQALASAPSPQPSPRWGEGAKVAVQ